MPSQPPNQQLQYIELSDFSPGIYAGWQSNSGAQAAPDGSAQLTNTWGCVPGNGGGLVAAPRKVQNVTQTLPANLVGNFVGGKQRLSILAFRVMPLNPTNFLVQSTYPDMVWLGWGSFSDNGTPGTAAENYRVRVYKPIFSTLDNPSGFDFVNATPQFEAQSTSGGGLTLPIGTPTNQITWEAVTIENTRFNRATPTSAGFASTIHSISGVNGQTRVYPPNAALSTDATDTLAALAQRGILVPHQDRVLALRGGILSSTIYGAAGPGGRGAESASSNELIDYTAVNDSTNANITSLGITFANENPYGYGSWVSMNASQLFLVKNRGGAIIVSGDIVNPSVTRMPGIASTLGRYNIGTMMDQGYVYGSKTGVWLWSGGDTSMCLSSQLVDDFWVAATEEYRFGPYGQFAYRYPYVYTPNSFLWHMKYNSWFRLNDPSKQTYSFYDNSGGPFMVAAPTFIQASSNWEAFAWFDQTQGTNEFIWTSQPLLRSRGRYIEAREIVLKAIGTGTITITLFGLDGTDDFVTANITVTDRPQLFSLPIMVNSSDVVCQIHSVGPTTAPSVLSLAIGYQENQTGRG